VIRASLVDSATGKILESFKTVFGRLLGITTYQKERGLWQSVSWVDAVAETVLVAPDDDGSIEICDVVLASEKKAGGIIRLHFEDSVPNEKDVINVSIADGSATIAVDLVGKVQGWQGASLRYTIVGTHAGSMLVTFVRHNKANSKTYSEMSAECGW